MPVADPLDAAAVPILDPISRLSEIMFGLLMTLTFTGTMSVALGEGGDVRSVLLAALGCNLAWGIVDGTMHILTSVTERGRDLARKRQIRTAPPEVARSLVRSTMADDAGRVITDDEVDRVIGWLKRLPDDGRTAAMTVEDARAAGVVFLLVVAATLPPALPFILFDQTHVAMRISNLIAVVMLFLIGWKFDELMNHTVVRMRLIVPLIGCLLVAVTIALGG